MYRFYSTMKTTSSGKNFSNELLFKHPTKEKSIKNVMKQAAEAINLAMQALNCFRPDDKKNEQEKNKYTRDLFLTSKKALHGAKENLLAFYQPHKSNPKELLQKLSDVYNLLMNIAKHEGDKKQFNFYELSFAQVNDEYSKTCQGKYENLVIKNSKKIEKILADNSKIEQKELEKLQQERVNNFQKFIWKNHNTRIFFGELTNLYKNYLTSIKGANIHKSEESATENHIKRATRIVSSLLNIVPSKVTSALGSAVSIFGNTAFQQVKTRRINNYQIIRNFVSVCRLDKTLENVAIDLTLHLSSKIKKLSVQENKIRDGYRRIANASGFTALIEKSSEVHKFAQQCFETITKVLGNLNKIYKSNMENFESAIIKPGSRTLEQCIFYSVLKNLDPITLDNRLDKLLEELVIPSREISNLDQNITSRTVDKQEPKTKANIGDYSQDNIDQTYDSFLFYNSLQNKNT